MGIVRHVVLSFALAGALGLAACGSDDDEATGTAEATLTPAQAVAEIGKTRAALEAALVALRSGARQKAQDAVAEGYLEHFEKVEAPLGKVDEQLKERIEDTLNEEIRGKIKDGASVAEVRRLVNETKADLAKAVAELQP